MRNISETEYINFLAVGGTLRVEIDENEISMTQRKEDESSQFLNSGFELPPP